MGSAICDGGTREWAARVAACPRCFRSCTWFGYFQAWYDPVWTCGRCGAQMCGGDLRVGSPRRDREQALDARAGFTTWLLTGSPRLEGL